MILICSGTTLSSRANEIDNSQSVSEDENGYTSLTVYNQNRALVKENKIVDLNKGINHLEWENLPSAIDVHSVNLRSLSGKGNFIIREQNYFVDVLTPESVLRRSIGKTVILEHKSIDGKTEERAGTLIGLSAGPVDLNASDGRTFPILAKVGERYVIKTRGEIELNDLPAGLVMHPKLDFVIKTDKAGEQKVVLAYETGDTTWQCDYVIVLDDTKDKFDLTGYIALDNHCGVSFKNVSLKLIAGSVQMNTPAPRAFAQSMPMLAKNNQAQEQPFADYHLYTVPEKLNIFNNQIKRMVLIERKGVSAEKKYIFDQQYFSFIPPKQKMAVQVRLQFQNDDTKKQPLPAGRVKVYQEDADHEIQLIGEDNIAHTPFGEKIILQLGEAFDVTGERNHFNAEQSSEHDRIDKFKLTFNNHSNKDIVVTDIEHCPDLAVFFSETPFTKLNSDSYQFEVKVPANASSEITYQIKTKM